MCEIQIFNEDCYKAIKNIPDNSIDLIITDPPYLFSTQGGKGMRPSSMDQIKQSQINIGIDYAILPEFLRVLKKPNLYIWCNEKQIPDYLNFFVNKQKLNFNIITWRKVNAFPFCGGKYLSDKEFCLYFFKGIKLNTTYSTAASHYELPINVEDKKLYGHPTIKPLEIIRNFVINSSNIGDTVLDPFLGSGTTAVACKELGRSCIGFEINEQYYNIAIDRLNGISQQDKILEKQGQLRLEV